VKAKFSMQAMLRRTERLRENLSEIQHALKDGKKVNGQLDRMVPVGEPQPQDQRPDALVPGGAQGKAAEVSSGAMSCTTPHVAYCRWN
jgi:hypothetical protein